MLKNYFKVALRHVMRRKLFSLLNVFCLATGITLTMLIAAYVVGEKNVNTTLRNIDGQYHIKSKWRVENMGMEITSFSPLAKALQEEYPHLIKNYYRFDPARALVTVDDKHFRVGAAIGDTTFISMYGFKVLHGNPEAPFVNNQSAVVTESFAIQFFGKKDVINQLISIQTPAGGKVVDFTISAVLKDLPYNNTVTNFTGRPYQVFLPIDNNQYFQLDGDKGDLWSNQNMVNMIELRDGVSPSDLTKPLEQVLAKYQPEHSRGNITLELEGVKGYYLKKNNEAIWKMIVTLLLIAGFILAMSIINFVNIHVGTSTYRLKEIGLRKIFGGARVQLIAQHFVEAFLMTCLGLTLSFVMYELLSPFFGQLLGIRMDPVWLFAFNNWVVILILVLTVSVLSGAYPAFALSALNVVQSAKGKTSTIGGGSNLRRVLLVTQFSLASVTFICALTVWQQVTYFFNKDLGYSKDQVLIVSSLPRQWDSTGVVKMEGIKTELQRTPNVNSVSLSYDIPDGAYLGYANIFPEGSNNAISMLTMSGDEDFGNVYGLTMLEGTFLKHDNSSNVSGHVVLNESAMKALGWSSAAGKKIRFQAGDSDYSLTVAGVVKDFHYASMQAAVQPLVFAYVNEPYTRVYRYFSFNVNTNDISGTIDAIKQKCNAMLPEAGFEYMFMNERFQSMYASELQLKEASGGAAVLMLVVMLMGIFGIVSFSLSSRTKEIAVRKVLGARAKNIIALFTKDYVSQIILANLIACPLAYLISSYWLSGYAYRIEQGIFPFVFAAGTMLIAAFTLIAVQCFRAAIANPVKDLKSE